MELFTDRIEKQSIDGEIAATRIGPGVAETTCSGWRPSW
jgi:hypothetical protein